MLETLPTSSMTSVILNLRLVGAMSMIAFAWVSFSRASKYSNSSLDGPLAVHLSWSKVRLKAGLSSQREKVVGGAWSSDGLRTFAVSHDASSKNILSSPGFWPILM